MKKETIFVFCFLFFSPYIAMANTGKCVLIVDGNTYLSNTCEIKINDSFGSFSIGVGNTHRSKYFAYVNMEDGKAYGYWNKNPDDDHAHYELGVLIRDGACWKNKNARICAYK